jgi:hypothetical protein
MSFLIPTTEDNTFSVSVRFKQLSFLIGCNSAYQIILEESDFCDQFMRGKKTTKSETNMKEEYRTQLILDKIIAFIVLDGDASIVKLFIDHGFKADTKLFNLSLLAWCQSSKYFQLLAFQHQCLF